MISSWKQSQFTPPPERALYLAAKEKIGPAVAVSVLEQEELKKLLMRRAIKTIPTLLSLQSEGSSIERLYKRGMLTDDMHFKVHCAAVIWLVGGVARIPAPALIYTQLIV